MEKMFEKRTKDVSIHISNDMCTGCGKCVERCRHGAMKLRFREDKAYAWVAYPDLCTGCGKCARSCKISAIEIEQLSSTDAGKFGITLMSFYIK